MTIHSMLLLAFVTCIYVMIPGPAVFALISRSMQGGVRAGVALTGGLLAVDLVYLCAAMTGLAFIAQHFQQAFFFVRVIGGAYLIWLGLRAWRSPAAPMTGGQQTPRSPARDLTAGLLTSASNPKAILFYMGLLPSFINLQALTAVGFVSTFVIVASAITLGSMGYILLSTWARRLFASARAVQWLNRVTAVVLAAVGLFIIFGTNGSSARA